MKIVLSMGKSSLDRVLNKEQWLVFLDEINKVSNKCPLSTKIYFRGIEDENNLLFGEANVLYVYDLHYNDDYATPNETHPELTLARHCAVKQLYLDWCQMKSINPNYNEGWFKSKKFTTYLNTIGWGGNYALLLDNITKYDKPRTISDISGSGDLIEIKETSLPLEKRFQSKQ